MGEQELGKTMWVAFKDSPTQSPLEPLFSS